MLPRWNSILNNLKFFLAKLEVVLSHKILRRSKRGRKPKRSIRSYLKLIIVKEYKNASLRDAEWDFSRRICRSRVDHSVIHYWEKKLPKEVVEKIVRTIAEEVERSLGYDFSVIDATKFTSWKNQELEFHILARIVKGTVYPSSVYLGHGSMSKTVDHVLVEGDKDLLCDAWYDDHKSLKMMFKRGYTPYVSPNTGKWRGRWRHKARRLYMHPLGRQKYRQRGRGESPFGSLTNEFGDRLKTSRFDTSMIRIGARIITYLVKIYMRIDDNLILIIILVNC
jgi:hypothetical protein